MHVAFQSVCHVGFDPHVYRWYMAEVTSVRVLMNSNTSRAKNDKGKRSLYPSSYAGAIAQIEFATGEVEHILINFVDHGIMRDVYCGTSAHIGKVAIKIQPAACRKNPMRRRLLL